MILLLPAAGRATRLPTLHGRSKEALTIAPGRRAADALLDAAAQADTARAIWLVRPGKADIAAQYGPRHGDMRLCYHHLDDTPSTLHTLRHALDAPELALDGETLGLGFPDIQFHEPSAFVQLEAALAATNADVALGCFCTDRPDKVDVVEQTPDGRVRRVHIKSANAPGSRAWILALWTPAFTRFLRARPLPPEASVRSEERYLGHEIQAAIDAGMAVTSVSFSSALLDLGTPEDLARAESFWRSN